jgi:hypothetical protein
MHPWCHANIINYHPSIEIWYVALWKNLDIKIIIFWNINLHHPLWLLMMVQDCDMSHNKKIATWHINRILEKLNKNEYLF